MSKFYQYDARGASHASQIINLERMVEEREAEIERLRDENETLRTRLGKWYALFFQQQADTLKKAKERDEAQVKVERLTKLIRYSLAPHVHVDMIDAMIRSALAGGLSDE